MKVLHEERTGGRGRSRDDVTWWSPRRMRRRRRHARPRAIVFRDLELRRRPSLAPTARLVHHTREFAADLPRTSIREPAEGLTWLHFGEARSCVIC